MKKIYLFITLLMLSLSVFSQNTNTPYEYSFQLLNITTATDAKYVIHDLRAPIGQKLITFNDDTDTFLLKSSEQFIQEDLYNLIEQNGYTVIQ